MPDAVALNSFYSEKESKMKYFILEEYQITEGLICI